MLIDHIGYLCKDINKSIKNFEELGYTQVSDIIDDNISISGNPPRNVLICFLKNQETCIELVSPNGTEPSVVTKQLQRQGEGPYHICYKVDNIDNSIHTLRESGWIIVIPPTPAVAFNNALVAFLFKKSVGIIELVEL